MLAEAFKAVEGLVQKANAQPHFYQAANEPKHVYFERQVDGQLVRRNAAPNPRAYRFNRLGDFKAAMSWLPHASRAVFIGEKSIIGILGEHNAMMEQKIPEGETVTLLAGEEPDRRDRINMPLTLSDAFAALLMSARSKEYMDHEDFIELLRIDLAGCLPPDVVTTLRHLKFENASKADSDISFMRQSVSKSVLQEMVAGEGKAVPEVLTFKLPVFATPLAGQPSWSVSMALIIDLFKGRFRLREMNGQLLNAMVMAQEWIAEQIAKDFPDALVVCGEVEC